MFKILVTIITYNNIGAGIQQPVHHTVTVLDYENKDAAEVAWQGLVDNPMNMPYMNVRIHRLW